MPITNYDPRSASTVVKREADQLASRDEGTVGAAVGPLEVGTIMVRDNAGALTALVGAAGANANCILLEAVPADNAEPRCRSLARCRSRAIRAEVSHRLFRGRHDRRDFRTTQHGHRRPHRRLNRGSPGYLDETGD